MWYLISYFEYFYLKDESTIFFDFISTIAIYNNFNHKSFLKIFQNL